MRVSVVIPCYNSLEFLPSTLDSVLDQDLGSHVISDYEVVLVDDGGSDNLAGWLADRDHPTQGMRRVRVVRQENAGVSAARNFGIRESSGDLVAFCDSDDLWTPDAVRLLAERFVEQPDIGMAYGWYDVIDADDVSTGRVVRSSAQGDVWESFVLDNPVAASGVMVSRAAIEDVGGFAENRDRFRIDVEDWELWIRLAARWKVGLVAVVVAHHRRHDSNSSTDIESLELAYENLIDVVFADVDPQRMRLRPVARARYKMILAWQSLNDREDPVAAGRYLRQARSDVPSLRRRTEYWRLRTAIALLGVTGDGGYRLLRGVNHRMRRLRNFRNPT